MRRSIRNERKEEKKTIRNVTFSKSCSKLFLLQMRMVAEN